MLNIMICELKKFKRMWIPLIIGVFILLRISTTPINSQVIKDTDALFTWVNLAMFSYGFLIAINLLIAYVFILEFKNNTMLTMMMYKHERWKVFVGKFITITIISLIVYLLEFGILMVIGCISFKSSLTQEVLMKHLILTLKAFLFQMLMGTITACIALASKKITTPVIYIAVQLIASFIFLSEPNVRGFIPFPLPVISNLMLIKGNYSIIKNVSIMPSQVIIAIIMFVGGIIYGCWYTNRIELE